LLSLALENPASLGGNGLSAIETNQDWRGLLIPYEKITAVIGELLGILSESLYFSLYLPRKAPPILGNGFCHPLLPPKIWWGFLVILLPICYLIKPTIMQIPYYQYIELNITHFLFNV
jgi:hypothetical protein